MLLISLIVIEKWFLFQAMSATFNTNVKFSKKAKKVSITWLYIERDQFFANLKLLSQSQCKKGVFEFDRISDFLSRKNKKTVT